MMPVLPQRAPTDPELKACLNEYREQAKTDAIETVWKRFRASACGKSWFDRLQAAYGHRCLYCDHSQVRCIDHRDAKSTNGDRAFAWNNFRPSCGDCNHQKGTRTIVDPVKEDPRVFIEYDVSTGKPTPSATATPARRKKAQATIRLLDLQTLNDARRAKRHKVLLALAKFVDREAGYDAAHIFEELAAEEPHRAIIRDLVLGAEADLHQWSPLVQSALRKLPSLKAWALAPTK